MKLFKNTSTENVVIYRNPCQKDLATLVQLLKDNLELLEIRHKFRHYRNVIPGTNLVNWFLRNARGQPYNCIKREDAISLAKLLCEYDFIAHVTGTGKEFVDKSCLYQFTNRTNKECEASSSSLCLSSVAAAITHPTNGVEVMDRIYRFTKYKESFIGKEAADWVVRETSVSREEAVLTLQTLYKHGLFSHVLNEHDFKDAELYYRFAEKIPTQLLVPLREKGEWIDWSDLEKIQCTTSSGSSVIWKGKWGTEDVCIKIVKLEDEYTRSDSYRSKYSDPIEDFRNEIWVLSGLSHPNIIDFKGFCQQPFAIVMEWMECGNLYSFIHESPDKVPFDNKFILKIATDIAKGMDYLHSKMMIHKDLKSPNILVCSSNKNNFGIKIADFGISRSVAIKTQLQKRRGTSSCRAEFEHRDNDNPVWQAPEMLRASSDWSFKVDVYSFGVILYELVTRNMFFDQLRFMTQIEEAVVQGDRPEIPDSVLPQFSEVIKCCWSQKPSRRPAFDVVLDVLNGINEYFDIEEEREKQRQQILEKELKQKEKEKKAMELENEKEKQFLLTGQVDTTKHTNGVVNIVNSIK